MTPVDEGPAQRQGGFLYQAAGVQRAATRGVLTRIRFAAETVTVTGSSDGASRTAEFPLTADRTEIAGVLPGEPAPAPGDAVGFPVTEPPLGAYAELLRDLGVHADAFDSYLGGGLRYVEITTDGRTSAHVTIVDSTGRSLVESTSLTSLEPAVGTPYTLVETFRASAGDG